MKYWSAAFDTIRRRSVEEIQASIGVENPFKFDVTKSLSEMPDFLESSWEIFGKDHESVINLPGRDVNLTRDILISAAKFYHVIGCARAHIARGATTWAMVDAYHAALIGARAVAALYGVLSYAVKGRTVLVDFRPEFGSKDDRRDFSRSHKTKSEPIRILRPTTKQLSQSDSWSLVERLCNITIKSEINGEDVGRLRNIALSKVSSFRNNIFYDSVAWSWRDDFGAAPAPLDIQHIRLCENDDAHSLTVNALTEAFTFTTANLVALCSFIGVPPNSISPLTASGADPVQLLG